MYELKSQSVTAICTAVTESEQYAEKADAAASNGRAIRHVSFRLIQPGGSATALRMSIEGRLIYDGGGIAADVHFDEATTRRIVEASDELIEAMPPGWYQAGSLMFELHHHYVQPTWH